ncbi:RING-H2 finger protein ATL72 [Ziziphus jujuba]|uniref:RING-H2 finger protein ATL72 n=1 Tax=Ziziphus jujuba TaxID=326968 RepID=A0A6P3ZW93_ZIZJJ|nr:RING-H2 finger protein ATL72 [Ziziphus jujuba]
MISPQPPPSPPFPLLGIAALIFTYVVICYLVIDFVGEVEEDISETPSSKDEESSGLSLQELQKVPCFNYGVGRSLVCAVCLDGIEDGEKCRMFPVCSHVYHAYCIDLWLIRKLSCPTCRAPLNITARLHNV